MYLITRLQTDWRLLVTPHQPIQVISIHSGGGETTVVKTVFYSEPEKIAKVQLARVLTRQTGGKILAEAAGTGEWDKLTDEQHQDFMSAASIIRGQADGRGDPRPGFEVEKGGQVGVVGSCGASRDGVNGHKLARASVRDRQRDRQWQNVGASSWIRGMGQSQMIFKVFPGIGVLLPDQRLPHL